MYSGGGVCVWIRRNGQWDTLKRCRKEYFSPAAAASAGPLAPGTPCKPTKQSAQQKERKMAHLWQEVLIEIVTV